MTAIHLGIWEHSSSYRHTFFPGQLRNVWSHEKGSWKNAPIGGETNLSGTFYWSDHGCGLRSFEFYYWSFLWGERWSRRSLPAKHKDCGWLTIKMIQMIQQFCCLDSSWSSSHTLWGLVFWIPFHTSWGSAFRGFKHLQTQGMTG